VAELAKLSESLTKTKPQVRWAKPWMTHRQSEKFAVVLAKSKLTKSR
jgi:hypothetical protein